MGNRRAWLAGGLAALVLTGAAFSEDAGPGGGMGGRPGRGQAGPTLTGVVKSVDATKRTLTVNIEGQGEKTFTLGEQVTILMRGPILDGIKPNDKVELRMQGEGATQTVRMVTVSRDGVTPANWTDWRRRGGGQ